MVLFRPPKDHLAIAAPRWNRECSEIRVSGPADFQNLIPRVGLVLLDRIEE